MPLANQTLKVIKHYYKHIYNLLSLVMPCVSQLFNMLSDHLIGLSGKGSARIILCYFCNLDYQPGQKVTFSNIIILPVILQPRSGVKPSIYTLQRQKENETHCCHQQERSTYRSTTTAALGLGEPFQKTKCFKFLSFQVLQTHFDNDKQKHYLTRQEKNTEKKWKK